MSLKSYLYILISLIIFTGCKKNDSKLNTYPTSLYVIWDNKPLNDFDSLRLLVYKSQSDYSTPFAKPMLDTVFTFETNYDVQLNDKYTVAYNNFSPGTYWFKIFSYSDGLVLYHNQNDTESKFTVAANKGNYLHLTTNTDSLKTFIVNSITVNNIAEMANYNDSLTMTIYAASTTLYSSNFLKSQLPYTVSGLNVPLRIFNPNFYMGLSSNNLRYVTPDVNFSKSLLSARVFNNNVYVFTGNNDNELVYVLKGSWVDY